MPSPVTRAQWWLSGKTADEKGYFYSGAYGIGFATLRHLLLANDLLDDMAAGAMDKIYAGENPSAEEYRAILASLSDASVKDAVMADYHRRQKAWFAVKEKTFIIPMEEYKEAFPEDFENFLIPDDPEGLQWGVYNIGEIIRYRDERVAIMQRYLEDHVPPQDDAVYIPFAEICLDIRDMDDMLIEVIMDDYNCVGNDGMTPDDEFALCFGALHSQDYMECIWRDTRFLLENAYMGTIADAMSRVSPFLGEGLRLMAAKSDLKTLPCGYWRLPLSFGAPSLVGQVPEPDRDPYYYRLSGILAPMLGNYFEYGSVDNLYRALCHQQGLPCNHLSCKDGVGRGQVMMLVYCLAKLIFNDEPGMDAPENGRYRAAVPGAADAWIRGFLERIELPASVNRRDNDKWRSFKSRQGEIAEKLCSLKPSNDVRALKDAFQTAARELRQGRNVPIDWEKPLPVRQRCGKSENARK